MYYLHYASGAESRPVGVRSQPSSDGARTGSAVWPNDVICCVDVLVVGAEEWAVLEDGGGYVNVRHPATGARRLRVRVCALACAGACACACASACVRV